MQKINIYQIEVTNHCNLACSYCPHDLIKREKGVISKKNIKQIIKILNSQEEIRIHHYGESLLFLKETYYLISKLKKKIEKIFLNSNGTLLTVPIIEKLFKKGLSVLSISHHQTKKLKYLELVPEEYRKRIHILKVSKDFANENLDIFLEYKEQGYPVFLKKERDLGLLKSKNIDKKNDCSFIKKNEFVVLWTGEIVSCCEIFDPIEKEILGDIYNPPKENKIFDKCLFCEGYGNSLIETELIQL